MDRASLIKLSLFPNPDSAFTCRLADGLYYAHVRLNKKWFYPSSATDSTIGFVVVESLPKITPQLAGNGLHLQPSLGLLNLKKNSIF